MNCRLRRRQLTVSTQLAPGRCGFRTALKVPEWPKALALVQLFPSNLIEFEWCCRGTGHTGHVAGKGAKTSILRAKMNLMHFGVQPSHNTMRNQQHVGLSVVSFIAIEWVHVVSEHRDEESLQHGHRGHGHRDTDEAGAESDTHVSSRHGWVIRKQPRVDGKHPTILSTGREITWWGMRYSHQVGRPVPMVTPDLGCTWLWADCSLSARS